MCFTLENADNILDKIDAILTEIEEEEVDLSLEKTSELMHGSANGPCTSSVHSQKRDAGYTAQAAKRKKIS